MRSHFNSGPNYKHLSYPSHTISLLLQVSLLVCASQRLVCLLVAYAMRQTQTLPQTASPQNNELLLCFVFSGADLMTSPYWAREEGERLRFCLCFPLWGICGGVGVQCTSERNPTWVEWEQRSPRKHWTSKTKHFLWKWIYLLAWLPEGPRQNGFLMGNRATVWGLPKDLHEKHLIWGWIKTVKSFRVASLKA